MRESQYEPRMIANREVRHVPPGWEHPRDERDRFVPLLPEQMPEPGNGAAIMAYETTSEGTPISPAFSDTPARAQADLVAGRADVLVKDRRNPPQGGFHGRLGGDGGVPDAHKPSPRASKLADTGAASAGLRWVAPTFSPAFARRETPWTCRDH